MAVKIESLAGIGIGAPAHELRSRPVGAQTREQRVAQARRRRRLARFQGVFEGALWIAGSGAVLTICAASLFALR